MPIRANNSALSHRPRGEFEFESFFSLLRIFVIPQLYFRRCFRCCSSPTVECVSRKATLISRIAFSRGDFKMLGNTFTLRTFSDLRWSLKLMSAFRRAPSFIMSPLCAAIKISTYTCICWGGGFCWAIKAIGVNVRWFCREGLPLETCILKPQNEGGGSGQQGEKVFHFHSFVFHNLIQVNRDLRYTKGG